MIPAVDRSRRLALQRLVLGLAAPLALGAVRARAAQPPAADPLLKEDEPVARALLYVEDAARAPDAKPGESCANCSQYDLPGAGDSAHCTLFPGRLVKAAGWCKGWSGL